MKESFEEQYHQVERDHWWFKSRRNYIVNFLKKAPAGSRILDIGCSSGILLNELKDAGFSEDNLYGVDISEKAIKNCRASGLKNCHVMDAQEIDLPRHSIDYIIASDCLEHLEDDRKALANWHSLLKKGGTAIVFVPAYKMLWSRHDEVNFHFRRYTNKELRNKMRGQGFKIKDYGYWNFTLFLPVLAVRYLKRLTEKNKENAGGDLSNPPVAVNKILTGLLNGENRIMKKIRFPFGVSTFCIARA